MAKTLLLADDSVTIQKVVGISFASEDVDLVTVDNGDDAVRRAKEIRPDAILADVVMPGMNGYEVCEAVKADPALTHVPVLLLTGTFEAFDEERAQRCGAAGHVAKPFEAQVLVERVRELFARSAAAAPPPPAPAAGPPSPAEALTQNPAAAPLEPAPPPPPSAPATDESFDFFDEQVSAPVAASPAPPAPTAAPPPAPAAAPPPAASPPEALTPPPTVPRDDSVALSSSDATFAFGDEDLDATAAAPEPAAPDPLAGAPPDRTIAIMPDDPADAGDPLPPVPPPVSLGDSFSAAADDDLLTADLGAPDPSPAVGDDAFDFELSDPGPTANPGETELVSPGDLASATVLDPKGASSFDVSYSDLGAPLAEEPSSAPAAAAGSVTPPEPTVPSVEPARPAMPATPGPTVEPTAPPVEPAPVVQPMASPEPPMPPVVEPATPGPAASWAAEPSAPMPPVPPAEPPVAEAEPLAPVLESPFEPPTAAPREEPEFASGSPEDSFSRGSAQAVDAPSGTHDPSALAGMALAEITPRLRQELHDTLEKIAWESFGNLTEQIVRQVMERAERVAWEVIPQMAETLIREEIRRMKGEPEGE